MSYKALVIGCGNIGSVWGNPQSETILSHAQAYSVHPSFVLEAVMDVDPVKAKTAAEKWQVAGFTSIEEVMKSKIYDVVSICVSTEHHKDVLNKISAYSPKVIILEKPIARSLNDAKQLCSQMASYEGIIVHYTRRFMPEFQALKEKVQSSCWGKFISGHSYYTKGVLHNGSHAIDLVRFFLGNVKLTSVFSKRNDYSSEDPTLSFSIAIEGGGLFCFLEADQNFSSLFEMELVFERARIRISQIDMVIEEFGLQAHPLWQGYNQWVSKNKTKIDFERELVFLLDHVVQVLQKRTNPLCNLSDALASQELCSQAIEESHRRQL